MNKTVFCIEADMINNMIKQYDSMRSQCTERVLKCGTVPLELHLGL